MTSDGGLLCLTHAYCECKSLKPASTLYKIRNKTHLFFLVWNKPVSQSIPLKRNKFIKATFLKSITYKGETSSIEQEPVTKIYLSVFLAHAWGLGWHHKWMLVPLWQWHAWNSHQRSNTAERAFSSAMSEFFFSEGSSCIWLQAIERWRIEWCLFTYETALSFHQRYAVYKIISFIQKTILFQSNLNFKISVSQGAVNFGEELWRGMNLAFPFKLKSLLSYCI